MRKRKERGEERRGGKSRGEVPVYMTTNGESRHQLSLAYVSPILSSCVVRLCVHVTV